MAMLIAAAQAGGGGGVGGGDGGMLGGGTHLLSTVNARYGLDIAVARAKQQVGHLDKMTG